MGGVGGVDIWSGSGPSASVEPLALFPARQCL